MQVWHFAWRHKQRNALWQPYGFVKLSGLEASLFHIYGFQQRVDIVMANTSIYVQTRLGEGDADFRVASLHKFDLRRTDDLPKESKALRFP